MWVVLITKNIIFFSEVPWDGINLVTRLININALKIDITVSHLYNLKVNLSSFLYSEIYIFFYEWNLCFR